MTPRAKGGALTWPLSALVGAVYAALAVIQHQRYGTGMDLAIFSQAARHLAEGQAPVSEIKGADYLIFGDHLHPIIVVLALPWRLWGDPRSLLIAQAVCLALALGIVGAALVRRVGTSLGLTLWACLALGIGVQETALFDVHEVVIGAPLVALVAAALLDGRLTHAAGWAATLPLVKEDMAVPMLGVAATLLLLRRWRLALALAVWAVAALLLALKVIIPALSPGGTYPYDGKIATHPRYLLTSLVEDGSGTTTLLVLVAGAGLLALRSPLVLAAAAPLGLRMISSNPAHWGLGYHYSLLPALLLSVAAADGLARTRQDWARRASVALAVAVTAGAVVLGPAAAIAIAATRPCERCDAAEAAVAQVPVGVEVAADDVLTPHLMVDRTVSHLTPNYWVDDPRRPPWQVLDLRTRTGRNAHGRDWARDHLERSLAEGYRVVWERDGYVVLTRG